LDNFSTGHARNIEDVRLRVGAKQWKNFSFVPGDVGVFTDCRRACIGVQVILHQAALGSVPRSLENPLQSHANNVNGCLNVFEAARGAGVERLVFASSSSVYGDNPLLPKIEENIGQPLSPYAATKLMGEIYASVYHRCYKLPIIGLRYFNVFGARQDPDGTYAAVIPRWIAAISRGEPAVINGDGETSRDFCYIANVLQANLLASGVDPNDALGRVFNVAVGHRVTLNELFVKIRDRVARTYPSAAGAQPRHVPERAGDVRHSLADIGAIERHLGYHPTHSMDQGLDETCAWYLNTARAPGFRAGVE